MGTIFKSEHGEVWKSPHGYGTYTAGHMLCIDLAKEIERLRAEIERCHARLEIDHVFVVPQGASALTDLVREEVPYQQRLTMLDGITARDSEIAILEEQAEEYVSEIERLRAELQQYRKAAGHETDN